VRERHQVEVRSVRFEGAEQSQPAPGVIEAIKGAEAILFAPSNPVTSIGPILSVPGIRQALREAEAPIAAVSPIIGGAAVSGPAAQLMQMNGWPSTIAGMVMAYGDFLDMLVADSTDEEALSNQRSVNGVPGSPFGIYDSTPTILCTNTMMHTLDDKRDLAAFLLEACTPRQPVRA
jgi:LPPG:FO 2-phospho-L-lactate transferase